MDPRKTSGTPSASHPYFALPVDGTRAQLLLTPCPGTITGDLETSLTELANAGAKALITLMTREEMARNGARNIDLMCSRLGMQWFHLPIEDEGVPEAEFEASWDKIRTRIHQFLDCHESVVIHCKGGSGRTGVVAARLLVERGLATYEAMSQIKALRPNAFVHPVQVNYVRRLACLM